MFMRREAKETAALGTWQGRVLIAAALLLALTYWAANAGGPSMVLSMVQTQDLPVLVLAGCAMIISAFWQPNWRIPDTIRGWHYGIAGAALAPLLAWGTYAVMGNFPLSRDEHMVVFDMAVFTSGRLAIPVAPQWQPFALALVPNFLLNAHDPIGFVSAYLPMNALLRAGFSLIADPAWYNPLLVVLGGAALIDISRRLFPGDSRACAVVMLVYATSPQLLANAMTDYAMTGHLALNLVWLAAFLRGGKAGHAVAIGAGFLAVGLHQLVFHPIFVAPFLLWKLRQGGWQVVALYAAAYAAICGWWMAYPMLVSPLVATATGGASYDDFLGERILPALTNRDPRTIPVMILNLLRLVGWMNLAMLPLLIAAVPAMRRDRWLVAFMLGGLLFWVVFLALVLPEQGRAWGYRYLNGYIGVIALLAGYGYREIEPYLRAKADGLVIMLSGATLLVALPLLLNAAHRFLTPHIAVQRLIEAQRTPFVVVDDEVSPTTDGRLADTAEIHVRNLPDLSNRPLRFSAHELTPALLAELCRRGPITLVTRDEMHRLGMLMNVPVRSPKFEALVAASGGQATGCFERTAATSTGAR